MLSAQAPRTLSRKPRVPTDQQARDVDILGDDDGAPEKMRDATVGSAGKSRVHAQDEGEQDRKTIGEVMAMLLIPRACEDRRRAHACSTPACTMAINSDGYATPTLTKSSRAMRDAANASWPLPHLQVCTKTLPALHNFGTISMPTPREARFLGHMHGCISHWAYCGPNRPGFAPWLLPEPHEPETYSGTLSLG